jgi:Matrixin
MPKQITRLNTGSGTWSTGGTTTQLNWVFADSSFVFGPITGAQTQWSGYSNATLLSGMQAATVSAIFQETQKMTGLRFTPVLTANYVPGASRTLEIVGAQNRDSRIDGVGAFAPGNTIGITEPEAGNVIFTTNNTNFTSVLDFENTAIHEIGHALGLSHPFELPPSGSPPQHTIGE